MKRHPVFTKLAIASSAARQLPAILKKQKKNQNLNTPLTKRPSIWIGPNEIETSS